MSGIKGVRYRGVALNPCQKLVLATAGGKALLEPYQLSLGTATLDVAVHQGRDAGRIVAAIFKALQCLDQLGCDRRATDYANDAAH